MKARTASSFRSPQAGSVIVIVMMTIIVLSLIGGSVMQFALTSYGLSIRNNRRLAAQSVAESELEVLFYRWQTLLKQGTSTNAVAAALEAQGLVDVPSSSVGVFSRAGSVRPAFNPLHRAAGWEVRRNFCFAGESPGQLPDDPKKTVTVAYFTAGVIVKGTDTGPNKGVEFRLGRRFQLRNSSIFQFAIFYQGDLELASGTDMDIRGPVAANGNIYAGTNQNKILRFYDTVSFGEGFNGDPTGATDTISSNRRSPHSPVPVDFLGAPKHLRAPFFSTDEDQAAARARLLKPMATGARENFIGGLDAAEIQARRSDLFATVNDVYRSVVEPPPAATVNEEGASVSTDDPVIGSRRMYNRAGLRITVTNTDDIQITDASDNDYTNNINFTHIIPSGEVRKDVYDQREGRTVKVTTINVAGLIEAIHNTAGLSETFNGVLYVTDKRTGDGVIRLINGATLPASGLTVATNNALYVQGNYNTISQNVSASLIADTVTLLSAGWDDAHSADAIGQRRADSNITVVAGILTGNTPTTSGTNSGGAQNLVRLMEDWTDRTVKLKGSIGQLFTSNYFTGAFPRQLGTVYSLPGLRIMEFDSTIASSPPPGAPPSTVFSRGDVIPSYN